RKLGVVSSRKVPARGIILSAALILLAPLINLVPQVSNAFMLFTSASSAVIIFVYVLIMLAHRGYRRSADFDPDGFVMPAYKATGAVTVAFFVFIYLTLFIASDTRLPAAIALIWLFVFGGYNV
ncbi:amino acid transporter, partial [Bacillus subtilis]|nr:amino acid transporter [Bacillus subtilis]